jgi:hypothetical protein
MGPTNNLIEDAHNIRCILDYGFQRLHEILRLINSSKNWYIHRI